jgi:hypothetical protein
MAKAACLACAPGLADALVDLTGIC